MLKSLEISGFKSFADRLRFDFAPGITGVVGPNGSGKSNVVDAIKWILGDQSAKSLRGKEMTDVIFNGASGRKPSPLAEATLTFDNSSGFLKVESAEVQIGRRIYRSGDAEYLINRAPARLKDVRDLFLGTGAGSSNYCIIEQGRVEQILQANVSARRLVFEEAAGISRFKARKTEAERKLERVNQNVARLTDIVNEVDAQLSSIRSQAVKAAKYRQVTDELRELWLGLAADQYRERSSRLAAADGLSANEQSLLQKLESRLAEIAGALAAVDGGLTQIEDRLREVERQAASYREQAARHEATVRHQSARLREMDQDLVRLRRQRATIEARARGAQQQLLAAAEQCARCATELDARKAELDAKAVESENLAAEVDTHRKALDLRKDRLQEKLGEITEATHRTAILEAQSEQHRAAILMHEERLRALDDRISTCREECTVHEERVKTAVEQSMRVGESAEELQQERLAMLGVHEQFHKSLAERREQRSAWRARKAVLEDLESRQEGLGIGVKDILNRARSAGISPWNQVLGGVADLLEVDLESAALVEISLGRRAQAVVINDLRPLIEYLNQAAVPIAGRVTFVAGYGRISATASPEQHGPIGRFLDRLQLEPEVLPDLSARPGVQCRADSLVRCSPKCPLLAQQLLCDTWIVDKAETAFELWSAEGRGCRFVTLQGELIDSDGALTVGALRGEALPVSQKSELRRLKYDLLRLDRQIEEDEQRLATLLATLNETDAELEAGKTRLQQASDHQAHCKIELADRERQLQHLQSERQALESGLQDHQQGLQQTHALIDQARLAFAVLDGAIQICRQDIGRLESSLTESEQRLLIAERKQNADRLELATQEQRLKSFIESQQRLEQDKRQFQQQGEEADRRLRQVLVDRRRVLLHVLNTSAGFAESSLEAETLGRRSARVGDEKGVLRVERAELLREESRLREERRGVDDRLHQLELQASELRRELEALSGRIEEEYQVKLSDVVAAGSSAVKLYLKARQAEVDGRHRSAAEETPEAAPLQPAVEGPAPMDEEVRKELEGRVNRMRRQLKVMGSVNTGSLQDLDDLERRFAHLSDQLADLVEAKTTLEEILRRVSGESKRLFAESFQSIRGHFQELFRKFFGGGDGDIVLEDSQDILECGIEVVARPPGKELRSISLLSGGEKTLTAVALLLAIFKSRPSPFCLLDEVDAALDEANVERFAAVLREFKKTTQFIMITHSKRSMAAADILYGVTMEESGVSKRLSVRFEDVGDNGEIRGSAKSESPRQAREAA